MPRLEVSKPFGVWSHQLLMNVNIDTRVFNLHVYLSAVCLTFQGRTRGINFQPGVRPNSGRSRSIFMALSLLLVLLLGVCHRIFSSKPRILLSCLLLCHFTPGFRKQKRWFYGSFFVN